MTYLESVLMHGLLFMQIVRGTLQAQIVVTGQNKHILGALLAFSAAYIVFLFVSRVFHGNVLLMLLLLVLGHFLLFFFCAQKLKLYSLIVSALKELNLN